MFILHSSNRTENLLAHLAKVIDSAPLNSVFAKETFLIQSQGMERWLSQQLATEFKVWGNFEFLFPGLFFSRLAKQIDVSFDDSVFDRRIMLWRFESLLRHLEDKNLTPLKHYLSGENISLKRFQLAQQLAQLFDQYQIMRPDLLAAWQINKCYYHSDAELWQMKLWQQITAATGQQHRGSLWQNIINQLNTSETRKFASRLPERISVFGLNTMPPLFLAFLQALSNHSQVHLYLLNPAQAYWADLQNKRQLANDESSETISHPLLSILGQQGREFQQLLLEQTQFELEFDSFEPVTAKNNLQQLQNDILQNNKHCLDLKKDHSISIHSCHSRTREVQIMKNELLEALEKDPALELRHIVVMAPDIQDYAPFISAVFSDIQHAIADRSLQTTNTLTDALLRFLRLSQSRLGWQAVLELLELPVVYRSFDLFEPDLELIEHWLNDTHIRWGRSAKHKQELGLPATHENTWQAGLERLLMGYACADESQFIDDILPYGNIEGSSSQALGGFIDFINVLFSAGSNLAQPKTLSEWSKTLFDYAEQLFSNRDNTSEMQTQHQQLNQLISELSEDTEAIHYDKLDLEVIINWLETTLDESKSSTGFLRGQLTFCSMLPMRSIPFKVIGIMGLNEGEFPKIDRHPSFDLLSQHFQKGDRSRRADDRYQFLEVLLSAREQLIITYLGQSIRQNETVPPSVIISEMVDTLEQNYQLSNLITKHPLQAFNPKYFSHNKSLFSYSQPDFNIAKTLQHKKVTPSIWWQADQQNNIETTIDLNELFEFYRHPQEYFFQHHLGIRFGSMADEPEEREPFAITGLDAYHIKQLWLEAQLKSQPFSVEKLQAQGLWLSGPSGILEFERQQKPLLEIAQIIQDKNLGAPTPDLSVDLEIDQYRLIGKLRHIHTHGSLFYRFAELKGKDLMQAWLHHLLSNQIQEQPTYLIAKNNDLEFPYSFAPQDILITLIELFLEGQSNPNLFFIDPAFAYVQQALKLEQGGKASKSAIDAAIDRWLTSINSTYEPELTKLFSAIGDPTEILNETFEMYCQTLLQPIWELTHGH